VLGETDELARVASAELGDSLVGLFIVGVVDGKDDCLVDTRFGHVIERDLDAGAGGPRDCHGLAEAGVTVGIDNQLTAYHRHSGSSIRARLAESLRTPSVMLANVSTDVPGSR
jgi:hypothetical protein